MLRDDCRRCCVIFAARHRDLFAGPSAEEVVIVVPHSELFSARAFATAAAVDQLVPRCTPTIIDQPSQTECTWLPLFCVLLCSMRNVGPCTR